MNENQIKGAAKNIAGKVTGERGPSRGIEQAADQRS
jgi:uncharacterized protein YjbJ (UPF0337 family)